jgi:hypothetical protein
MKKILYTIGVLLLLNACSDSYLDINENPNSAVSSTPELTLTNALNVTAARLSPNELGAFWAGQWSPSGSVSGFTPEKTYDITTTFRTGIWTGPYDNLEDYKYVEEEALAVGKKSIAGIARVMKAFNYQMIVDAYGNVPYSDALKGTESIRPAYDDASVIYDSLINDLNVAITYLSVPVDLTTNTTAGPADIYFSGNTAKWIKFANTLKLRILLRQSNVASKQSFIASELSKLPKTSAGFLSADESVLSNPGYIKSAGKMNQWYENYGYTAADARSGSHDFYCWSEYLVNKLSADPRLPRLAYPVSGTTYVGAPFGEGSDQYLYSKVSGFGPAFLPQDGTVSSSDLYKRTQVIMNAAESFFLQAEAVERYSLVSDKTSQVLYQEGIVESFKLLGVTNAATQAANYYAQEKEDIGWTSSSNKIKAIITQKWIALAGYNGFEAWTEYRRTGYPNDIPLSTKANSSVAPVRLLYPLSEYSNNATNVTAQGAINQFSSKIFWMN